MTFSAAISTARQRVSIIHYGQNDFTVQEYLPKYKARTESQHMDVRRARAVRREALIRVALELLGEEEAGVLANVNALEEGRRWDQIVRDIHKSRTQ